jgi:hypothetical protein
VWRYRLYEQSGDANPLFHKIGVHTNLGGDFTIPVTRALQLIEAVLECLLVECPEERLAF